jgi:hypothetical protein
MLLLGGGCRWSNYFNIRCSVAGNEQRWSSGQIRYVNTYHYFDVVEFWSLPLLITSVQLDHPLFKFNLSRNAFIIKGISLLQTTCS